MSSKKIYEGLVKSGRLDSGDLLLVVDGKRQKLYKVVNGDIIKKYKCSTGKAGFGNSGGGKTSTGLMYISDKVGAGQPTGRIFVAKQPTPYILDDNQGKHAWVLTRVLVLRGQQAENENVYDRHIYIHGTNRKKRLGRRVSGGCIRVSNDAILELFSDVPEGTLVYVRGTGPTNPPFPEEDRAITSKAKDALKDLGSEIALWWKTKDPDEDKIGQEPDYD